MVQRRKQIKVTHVEEFEEGGLDSSVAISDFVESP